MGKTGELIIIWYDGILTSHDSHHTELLLPLLEEEKIDKATQSMADEATEDRSTTDHVVQALMGRCLENYNQQDFQFLLRVSIVQVVLNLRYTKYDFRLMF